MKNAMKEWMLAATVAEQYDLAARAGTSRWYLYQIARGRDISADLASRIEQASKILSRRSKGRLAEITRGETCTACSVCPYYNKCKGGSNE